jgi:hypothetical protein
MVTNNVAPNKAGKWANCAPTAPASQVKAAVEAAILRNARPEAGSYSR